LLGASGDVLAARRAALELLGGARVADPARATLVLTAALLHCGVRSGGQVSRRRLAIYLRDLVAAETPGPGLLRSPMQFVRYAAVELQALAAPRRTRLLADLMAAVRGVGLPDHPVDDHTAKSRPREPL
jgi:hypothetical protein